MTFDEFGSCTSEILNSKCDRNLTRRWTGAAGEVWVFFR